MNKVVLIGRTTKDIEIRKTNSGKSVARLNLAVNRRSKEDGADFISCVAFGKTAELLEQYVKKGNRVAIEGRIMTGSYERDGQKVYTTDVIVNGLEFLENKKQSGNIEKQPQTEEYGYSQGFGNGDDLSIDFDDLPF